MGARVCTSRRMAPCWSGERGRSHAALSQLTDRGPWAPAAGPTARHPRHPPVAKRVALAGSIFVLETGIPWEYFSHELGCCGMPFWRRLRDWQRAGVWEQLHHTLLQRLADAGKIDWRRASADASRVPAKGGALRPGRTRPIGASRAASTI